MTNEMIMLNDEIDETMLENVNGGCVIGTALHIATDIGFGCYDGYNRLRKKRYCPVYLLSYMYAGLARKFDDMVAATERR